MAADAQQTPQQQLDEQLRSFEAALPDVADEPGLYELQVRFLGKNGAVTKLRRLMGKVPPSERKELGKAFNRVKQAMETHLATRAGELAAAARERDLARRVDLTFIPDPPRPGTLHPITQTRRELERVFRRLGFDVADGPHVEAELYSFDKLNILPDHPARDMQDTFFIERPTHLDHADAPALVLRPHTSPVQARTMLQHGAPVRIVAPGTTFRRDDDATHSPMFHQIEGLYVDRNVTMADLKATLYAFVEAFFGRGLGVRFRPSYFPFVEPGAEFDMQCPFCFDGQLSHGCGLCKQSGWIELGGSGMVHPAVFEHCGIDSSVYTGWAFGFGIDRMAMLRHGIPHLRHNFEGDLRVLEQFTSP
ncbi:Phenylalanine--tRNA ligase alpha subunit [Enhygromyxa salina]|uniref:Phenylalanine--tRNA ligase alpha subunit n=1 Tax=Enhygromyxa salina TaxID=215803 RepID=A0A2S9YE56_9BACT|nr:phenylalanine--tRNA ligase subunit alpha [Enhygromyxa salina]PRQ03322.1 Phenylalanine--tRNA ligase alpha subunit [Enhygromyxa salina]